MRLTSFKIQNFKKYNDTDWIKVDNLTAFVGKNESGKSSLFQGLSKLNPTNGKGYDEFRELPRRLLTELQGKNQPVASGRFILNEEEKKFLKTFASKKKFDTVEVTRYYGDKYTIKLLGKNIELEKEGRQYVINKMPKFLYFDDYYTLHASINIPEYLQKFEDNPDDKKLRVINSLFSHVGLDLQVLEDYDPNKKEILAKVATRNVEKRRALCDAAQVVMTDKFSKWWLQHKHVFHYNTDSDYFHISVSDDLDASPIVLEERSMGMKYFFSFYLIFLEETKEKHENTILLLDEPGLHYHGTMQIHLIEFFKTLSKENQVFYNTHSPFMVDSKNLDSIKAVHVNIKTGYSEVSEADNWPKDFEAMFPIRVGWWYDVLTSYITKKIHVVVEGQSDVEIINAMNNLLERKKKTTLRSNILCVPGGGNRTVTLLSLLRSENVEVILFQDGDEAGINRSKQLHKKFGIPYCTTSDFIKKELSSIEDLFPQEFFMKMVKNTYSQFNLDVKEINSESKIIDSLNALFDQNSLKLDKLKIAKSIEKKIDEVPLETIEIFEKIFTKINGYADSLSSK